MVVQNLVKKNTITIIRDGGYIEQPPIIINVSELLKGNVTDLVQQYEKICNFNCIMMN